MSKAPIVDPLSTNVGDEALYGPATLPPVRANAVQQIPLEQIRPDWKQPRRAIPVAVMHHDWKTVNVRRMLSSWADRVGLDLKSDTYWLSKNLPEWLRSEQPLPDLLLDKASGVVADFFELVTLAASIYAHGLTNPITVVQEGDHYVIETGERRFLAYSLLSARLLSDGKWDSIPALVVQQSDVWRQAAENGSRQPLNAIGMARQIALLVMDMYKGDEGVGFQRFEDLVSPGECDQAYYAQVKKGTAYPIKKGELERVLAVTGLKSSDHVSLYRQLLDIDPELWVKADRENLTEGAIRALRAPEKPEAPEPPREQRADVIIASLAPSVLTELVVHRAGEQWTRETEESLRAAGLIHRNAITALGHLVRNRHREMAQEEQRTQRMIQRAHVRYERDQDYVPEQEDAIQVEQAAEPDYEINDRVLVDGQHMGTVRYIARKEQKIAVAVTLDHNGRTAQYAPQRLTLVKRAETLAEKSGASQPALEIEPFRVGSRVIVDGKSGTIRTFNLDEGTYGVFLDDSGTTHYYKPESVTFMPRWRPERESEPEASQPAPEADEPLTLHVNDRVLVDGERAGVIRYVAARKGTYGVFLDASSTTHHYKPERVKLVSRTGEVSVESQQDQETEEESQPAADSPTIVGLSLAQDDKYLTAVLAHCRELSELLGLPDYVQYTMHKLQMMAPANVLAMQRNPVAAGKVLDTYEMHATMLLEGLQARVFTYIQDLRDSVEQAS